MIFQVAGAFQEQEAAALALTLEPGDVGHTLVAARRRKPLTDPSAHRHHRVVGHPQDVEFVDDDPCGWQEPAHYVAVRPPHVHHHHLDPFWVRELNEVSGEGQFIPLGQQLEGATAVEVGDDESGDAVNITLIYAYPPRCLPSGSESLFQAQGKRREDVVDGWGANSRLGCYPGERLHLHRLALNVTEQPLGHSGAGVNPRQGLLPAVAAGLAQVALPLKI